MTTRRRRIVLVALSVALLVLAWGAHRLTRPRIANVTLVGPDGRPGPVAFPYSGSVPTGRPTEFRFDLTRTRLSQQWFVFVPDDHLASISVDGVAVPLEGIDPKKLDDYHDGFRFPLGLHAGSGTHRVAVVVTNRGGPGGLDVHPDPQDWRASIGRFAGAAAGALLLALVLRAFGWSRGRVAMVVGALLLRVAYLGVTPYSIRNHDVEGHVEYVRYLIDHRSLPRAADGYAFYHPPLYFIVSALQWALLSALGVAREDVLQSLQVQSLASELGFAFFAMATGRLWLERMPDQAFGRWLLGRRGLGALLDALVLFWPSTIIHSVRLGNDDLTYLLIGGGLYFASRWWLRGGSRDAYVAAAFAAFGVVTKTNSLLVFVVLAGLLAARVWQRWPIPIVRTLGRTVLPAALLLGSAGLALGRSLIETLAGRQGDVLIANAHRNSGSLVVGNRADNYLWFDAHAFVTQAFMNPWEDVTGRQYFWNYLLKTSIIGEFQYQPAWAWNQAVVLSVLLLGMGAFVVATMLARAGGEWLDELPLVLTVGIFVVSLVAMRMRLPSSCTGDFRYILPVVGPLAWWYVRGIGAWTERGRRRLARWAVATGWLFVGSAIAFVLVVVTQ